MKTVETEIELIGSGGEPATVRGHIERLQQTSGTLDFESVVRFAVEKNASPETIATLMGVRRELKEEEAKRKFDAAMRAFQAECPVITKGKAVPTESGATAYKYAPFEVIISVAKPYLDKHQLSYKLDTDVEAQPGWVIAACIAKHDDGHFETSKVKLPLGTKTRVMSDTQVNASALTFACRRAFCNAFGIVTAGEDMDGAGANKPKAASPKVATDATRAWMLAQLKNDGVTREQMFAYAIDSALIEPNGKLEDWPLASVPVTTAGLMELKSKIQAHK